MENLVVETRKHIENYFPTKHHSSKKDDIVVPKNFLFSNENDDDDEDGEIWRNFLYQWKNVEM